MESTRCSVRVRRRRGESRRATPAGPRLRAVTSSARGSSVSQPPPRRPKHVPHPPSSIALLRSPASASPASLYVLYKLCIHTHTQNHSVYIYTCLRLAILRAEIEEIKYRYSVKVVNKLCNQREGGV